MDDTVVEADVVVPFSSEDQGEGWTLVSDVCWREFNQEGYFLIPDLLYHEYGVQNTMK